MLKGKLIQFVLSLGVFTSLISPTWAEGIGKQRVLPTRTSYSGVLNKAGVGINISDTCVDLFKSPAAQSVSEKSAAEKSIEAAENARKALAVIYESEISKWRDMPYTYGFESEYTLDKYSSRLLNVYGPTAELGVSQDQWSVMQSDSSADGDLRVNWVKENLKSLFAQTRVSGNLVLLNPEKLPNYLPQQLILDSTGNLEIVLDPVRGYENWLSRVQWINPNLGTGSMQGTFGLPKNLIFDVEDKAEAIKANLGFFQFMADLDSMHKLLIGYQKYLTEPGKPAASAFQHQFLGPLTKLKREFLTRVFTDNMNGVWDSDVLKSVGHDDDSFKYIGATTYRPDLGGKAGAAVFEVRDAHSNEAILKEKVLRVTFYFSHTRSAFAVFADEKGFDSEASFEALPSNIKTMLMQLFPQKKLEEGVEYNSAEVIANQVYRNFAFPLRDWSVYWKNISQASPIQITRAQMNYINSLVEIESRLAKKEITTKEASLLVQGALSRFSADSEIVENMFEWLKKLTDQMVVSINDVHITEWRLVS
jgi:hypothetical protein